MVLGGNSSCQKKTVNSNLFKKTNLLQHHRIPKSEFSFGAKQTKNKSWVLEKKGSTLTMLTLFFKTPHGKCRKIVFKIMGYKFSMERKTKARDLGRKERRHWWVLAEIEGKSKNCGPKQQFNSFFFLNNKIKPFFGRDPSSTQGLYRMFPPHHCQRICWKVSNNCP